MTNRELNLLETYAGNVLAVPQDARLSRTVERKLQDLLYYASVRAVDDSVANIYDTLVKEGVSDNTLFIFASDNGALASGPTKRGNNGKLRGGKGTPHEGGHRVANFMIWPDQIAAGQAIDSNIWIGDLAPSFISVAGGNVSQDMHGMDVSDAWKDNRPVVRGQTNIAILCDV